MHSCLCSSSRNSAEIRNLRIKNLPVYRFIMGKESLVGRICICLETLTNVKKSDSSPNECNPRDPKEALLFELKKHYQFAFEVIEKYDDLKSSVEQYIIICYKKKCKETCDYLQFLELNVVLLKLLCEALLAEESEQDPTKNQKASVPHGLLSISQQKIVNKSLNYVVHMGILPNLLHGVGIPLSRRSEHPEMVEIFACDLSPRQKHAQIVVCVETLLCCTEISALQGLLHYHKTDVIAALFQLCHAPIEIIVSKDHAANDNLKKDTVPHASQSSLSLRAKNAEDKAKGKDLQENFFLMKLSTMKDYSFFSDQQLNNERVDDRNYFTPKFEKFLKQMHRSLLINELLLFKHKYVESKDTESATPKVLRKICSQMLSNIILQNNGLEYFVQVVLGLDKPNAVNVRHHGRVDIKRLDAVACLIAYNEAGFGSMDDYIRRLSKQVLDLLVSKGSSDDSIVGRFELHYIASSIILHICDRYMKMAQKYFLDVLFRPLWMCVTTTGEAAEIVVEEKVLSHCIEAVHKIFVESTSPLSRKHMKLLFPFFHCLLKMYIFLMEGVSTLKSKVKSLLSNILSSASDEDATSLLHVALLSIVDDKGISVHLTTVDFAYGDEVGIRAVKQVKEDITELDINCRAISELLSELKKENLNRSFILLVLKVVCSYHKEDLRGPDNPKYEKFLNLLSTLGELLPKWDIDIGEALMSNVSEVVEILVILLDSMLKGEDDDYDERMMIVLVILNALIQNELSSSDWAMLKKCLPHMGNLMNKPISTDLKEMLSNTITCLATHGVAGDSNSFKKMHTCSSEHPTSDQDYSSTVDTSFTNFPLHDMPVPESSDKSSGLASVLETKLRLGKNLDKYSLEKAVQLIKDPSITSEAEGLDSFEKLLRRRDEETLHCRKDLLPIFLECLNNEDSFIYGRAINCIVLLADIDAELVLPTILKIYQNPGDRNCQFVLNIGEVLQKICCSLGELIYKYKEQILHTFLVNAKHDNPQICSSSLSNLAEACKHLKFNLHGWLQEILMCARSFLQHKDVEVCRSAVFVIKLVLEGVGKDMLQVLENEMADIHRLLKTVQNTTSDEVVQYHCEQALKEISKVINRPLQSVRQLPCKEIRITNL